MTAETIRQQGIIAIVREATPERAMEAVETLLLAGIRAVEVSLVTPGAMEVVRDVAGRAPKGASIGVGTVLTAGEVHEAVAAGARFIVSPIATEEVVRTTVEAGLTSVPGVATPSEAVRALRWGADFVKIFPASLWTPSALRDVLAALPALSAVPTGGVSLTSAPEWIRAGAVAVGIGSTLTRAADPKLTATELVAAISAARES